MMAFTYDIFLPWIKVICHFDNNKLDKARNKTRSKMELQCCLLILSLMLKRDKCSTSVAAAVSALLIDSIIA